MVIDETQPKPWLDTASPDENLQCGRPLGIAFDTMGENLIVVHSSKGIFEVDLKSGDQKLLVSDQDLIGTEVSQRTLIIEN